jgi:predicted dehydrogenase
MIIYRGGKEMRVNWGIIGAGNIAHRFSKALSYQKDSSLIAISGRSRERLTAFAKEFSVKRVYMSHEELLEDPQIDAVYVALPHDLHAVWTVRALRAQKAVLVEKPAALNASEVKEICTAASENRILFMEAQKARFTPLYRELKRRVEEGSCGKLIRVETSLCNEVPAAQLRAAGSYLYDPAAGGALLDCGTYCASLLEDFCGGGPRVIRQESRYQYGVDHYIRSELAFGGRRLCWRQPWTGQNQRRPGLYWREQRSWWRICTAPRG